MANHHYFNKLESKKKTINKVYFLKISRSWKEQKKGLNSPKNANAARNA